MSELNDQPAVPDVVGQSAEALRATAIPTGPPSDVVEATLSAIEARLAGSIVGTAPRATRRPRLTRVVWYGALAASSAVLLGAALLGLSGSAKASLEKAFEKVESADAVRLRVRLTFSNGVKQTNTVTVRGNKLRVEDVGAVGITWVIDRDEKAALLTWAEKRLYQTVDTSQGTVSPSEFYNQNPREQLLALRKQKAVAAGAEKVDGELADKYVVAGGKAFHLEGDWVVWVGRKSGLPVRVSVETNTRGMGITRVYDSFDWNPKTDATTFSLDPPPGFKEGTVFGIVPALPPRKK